eukprot:8022731-Lingulodinium_polyedra.AAC.1
MGARLLAIVHGIARGCAQYVNVCCPSVFHSGMCKSVYDGLYKRFPAAVAGATTDSSVESTVSSLWESPVGPLMERTVGYLVGSTAFSIVD